MLKNTKAIIAGLAFSTVISGLALGAVQGIVGTTSQGSLSINASKGNSVRISGLTDIFFPGSANVPAPSSQSLCIYSTTGSYTIQPTGGNSLGTQFRLKDTGTDYIFYTVCWASTAAAGAPPTINSGTTTNGNGANTTSTTCNGVANATLQITIDSGTFAQAPAGPYSDTLTLVVAPV